MNKEQRTEQMILFKISKYKMLKWTLNLNFETLREYVNSTCCQFKSLIYDNFSQTKGLFITTLVSKVNHCTAEISNQNLLR